MSNVRITATGDVGIEVEIKLGVTSRGKHLVNAGESVDLTVGGNQSLITKESDKAAPAANADIPVGVDVSSEPDPAEDNPENGDKGLFGDWFGNSDIDAGADADAPVQGDLFDDSIKSEN